MSLSFSYSFGYIPGFTQSELSTSTETYHVRVKVYPLFYNKIVVEWSVPASLGDCSFNVYKGDTDEGPWLKINQTPISLSNFIEDTTTQDFSKFKRSYYIVEVQLPAPDYRYIKSPPKTWENSRNNIMEIRANEIIRRETILLSKFIGVDTLVFRRKYFGKRCPNCYDLVAEKVVKDNCQACYGTSFLGGYYPGIQTRVCYDVTPNNTSLTYLGKMETAQTTAWTISYPKVDTLDVIIRIPDFKIFRVDMVNATELQTVQVRQLMQITELNKASIEMKLIEQLLPEEYVLPRLLGSKSTSKTGYVI